MTIGSYTNMDANTTPDNFHDGIYMTDPTCGNIQGSLASNKIQGDTKKISDNISRLLKLRATQWKQKKLSSGESYEKNDIDRTSRSVLPKIIEECDYRDLETGEKKSEGNLSEVDNSPKKFEEYEHPLKQKPYPYISLRDKETPETDTKKNDLLNRMDLLNHSRGSLVSVDEMTKDIHDKETEKKDKGKTASQSRVMSMDLDANKNNGPKKSKTGLGDFVEDFETKATWTIRTNYFQNILNGQAEKNTELERQFFLNYENLKRKQYLKLEEISFKDIILWTKTDKEGKIEFDS